jgi:hypothetical protein
LCVTTLTCSEYGGPLLRLIWSLRLTNVKEIGTPGQTNAVNHSICVTDVQKETVRFSVIASTVELTFVVGIQLVCTLDVGVVP